MREAWEPGLSPGGGAAKWEGPGGESATVWKINYALPGGPVVRTWHFHCSGTGSIPGWGTKIPQVAWRGQKILKRFKTEEALYAQIWRDT